MSETLHVVGFRPPDKRWTEMKAIWEACKKAGIVQHPEVMKFFNDEPPDNAGVVVELERTEAVTEFTADMREGFEIDISKLPPGLSIIRVYNSY